MLVTSEVAVGAGSDITAELTQSYMPVLQFC